MIKLTRLNGKEYYLNSDMIETVEATPDTIITTVNGKKFVVREPVGEVVARVVRFRVEIGSAPAVGGQAAPAAQGAAQAVAGGQAQAARAAVAAVAGEGAGGAGGSAAEPAGGGSGG
jgi:flagellar protein FlbD